MLFNIKRLLHPSPKLAPCSSWKRNVSTNESRPLLSTMRPTHLQLFCILNRPNPIIVAHNTTTAAATTTTAEDTIITAITPTVVEDVAVAVAITVVVDAAGQINGTTTPILNPRGHKINLHLHGCISTHMLHYHHRRPISILLLHPTEDIIRLLTVSSVSHLIVNPVKHTSFTPLPLRRLLLPHRPMRNLHTLESRTLSAPCLYRILLTMLGTWTPEPQTHRDLI